MYDLCNMYITSELTSVCIKCMNTVKVLFLVNIFSWSINNNIHENVFSWKLWIYIWVHNDQKRRYPANLMQKNEHYLKKELIQYLHSIFTTFTNIVIIEEWKSFLNNHSCTSISQFSLCNISYLERSYTYLNIIYILKSSIILHVLYIFVNKIPHTVSILPFIDNWLQWISQS